MHRGMHDSQLISSHAAVRASELRCLPGHLNQLAQTEGVAFDDRALVTGDP